jgi:integrase/recombinase XerD
MNTKIINALRDYLKDRTRYSTAEASNYLFVSKKNETLNRTVVNRIFQHFSLKLRRTNSDIFSVPMLLRKG